jgi:hypothetical protein
MVAEKRFSKQSFAEDKEMMMSGVSYRGMHIPFFDEKKLAVWKHQMESIFFTIGCLGIARGDAKKNRIKQFGLSPEEIPKRSEGGTDSRVTYSVLWIDSTRATLLFA